MKRRIPIACTMVFLFMQVNAQRAVRKDSIAIVVRAILAATPASERYTIDSSSLRYSQSGERVYFLLKEKPVVRHIDPKMVKLDIWTYADAKLMSQQVKDSFPKTFMATIALQHPNQVVRIEKANEQMLFKENSFLPDDIAVVVHWKEDVLAYAKDKVVYAYTFNEYNWNRATQYSLELISLVDGKIQTLMPAQKATGAFYPYVCLSPEQAYLLYYDPQSKNYFSRDLQDSGHRNLTGTIRTNWETNDPEGMPRNYRQPVGIAGWVDDHTVLLYDHFHDLWRIDLSGKQSAVNITHGFGKQHVTQLHEINLLLTDADQRVSSRELLLSAINSGGQFNYYRIKENGLPEPLIAGDEFYWHDLMKARDSSGYYLIKENYETAPQRLYTADFTTFAPVTLTTDTKRIGLQKRLIRWQTKDGKTSIGTLWLPMNVDSNKTYPVIVAVYEKYLTGKKFSAQPPANGIVRPAISPTYAVTNGYCFFEPDIHYSMGATGQSVTGSIEPAIATLKKLRLIDGRHIGIYGHSFGGYEVNLLMTRSKSFAAAASGSGLTDMVSNYGLDEIDPLAFSHAATTETGQMRLNAILWEHPQTYIENSPVYAADKITTPLLIGVGQKDLRVPASQGIALFKALRRLGKKTWLVSYDEGTHNLIPEDWGRRVMQFFDYYLKNKPAPVWMVRGIPANQKGTTLGWEYDSQQLLPEPLLITDKK